MMDMLDDVPCHVSSDRYFNKVLDRDESNTSIVCRMFSSEVVKAPSSTSYPSQAINASSALTTFDVDIPDMSNIRIAANDLKFWQRERKCDKIQWWRPCPIHKLTRYQDVYNSRSLSNISLYAPSITTLGYLMWLSFGGRWRMTNSLPQHCILTFQLVDAKLHPVYLLLGTDTQFFNDLKHSPAHMSIMEQKRKFTHHRRRTIIKEAASSMGPPLRYRSNANPKRMIKVSKQ
jgi:hypothetical protein